MASPSRGRTGIIVPNMVNFALTEHWNDGANMKNIAIQEGDSFSFPADKQFWAAFSAACQENPDSKNPPHFVVDASHTTETITVNQDFCRRFLAVWEKGHPHIVTVRGPNGGRTFRTSEEFWMHCVSNLSDTGVAEGDPSALSIQSSLAPRQVLRSTQAQWEQCLKSWDIWRVKEEERLNVTRLRNSEAKRQLNILENVVYNKHPGTRVDQALHGGLNIQMDDSRNVTTVREGTYGGMSLYPRPKQDHLGPQPSLPPSLLSTQYNRDESVQSPAPHKTQDEGTKRDKKKHRPPSRFWSTFMNEWDRGQREHNLYL
eukprot:PhF_6_TR38916/c0_g1_i1/m.58214